MEKKPNRLKLNHVLTYVFILVVVAIYVVPLGYALITSLKTPSEFMKNPVGLKFIPTLTNYISAWKKANFQLYVLNSVLYTGVGTAVTLLCALLIAYPVARKYVKHPAALYFFLMIGMFLPDGTIPLFQLMLKLHLYNTRLGYIISTLAIGGTCMMFLTSFIKSVPKELDEAAIIDGAGYFNCFFRVILPLCKPAIASMAILTGIGIWNDIVKSVIFLSDAALLPITKGLFVFSGQYSTSWTELMAALVMVSIPLVVVYITMQKHVVGGLTAGSVKM